MRKIIEEKEANLRCRTAVTYWTILPVSNIPQPIIIIIIILLGTCVFYSWFVLISSTDEPMISEVQSNVVDGINLDEMKDFAKAFKLRRLSLGLTQTQVGQALSVTEGPAYSQSAICRLANITINIY